MAEMRRQRSGSASTPNKISSESWNFPVVIVPVLSKAIASMRVKEWNASPPPFGSIPFLAARPIPTY